MKTRKHNRLDSPSAAAPKFEQLEDRLLLSLLGFDLEFPQAPYDATGTMAYTAATQSFDADATPLAFRFAATEAKPIVPPRDFQLRIQVDSTGGLVGGVAGDDLLIEGKIDRDGDGVYEYDGVLITGEILEFGFLDSGGTVDQYDFRFDPTGGQLVDAGLYAGKDIGVTMTSANSTFANDFTVDFNGKSQGVIAAIESLAPPAEPGSIAGRVYLDANNNGMDDGEEGIELVEVALTGTDVNGNAVSLTTVTDDFGNYIFDNVMPGDYVLTETQPDDLLDNDETAGTAGGVVGDDVISEIALASAQDATGYTFGELEPAAISGLVWVDFNNDGEVNFNEDAIQGVELQLTGVDDRGDAVSLTTVTDVDGEYVFLDLRPGNYTVTEVQPAGYVDGMDVVGTEGGTLGNDVISDIDLGIGVVGMNYDFGERPEDTGSYVCGQTHTIGWWRNKHGKRLVLNLNGGAEATQLGNWLAATFPNMYGTEAGENDLTGATNYQVWRFFVQTFKARKCGKWWKRRRRYKSRTKVDSQVMAVALATYVTNQSLAGDVAENYGFIVTDYGLGTMTYNVGNAGAAFAVENGTEMTIMDMLLATNDQAVEGQLYNGDHQLRALANAVYTAINEAGKCGCSGEALRTWFQNRLQQLLSSCLS